MITEQHYKRSVGLALKLGYVEEANPLGYRGRIYIKEGKIWIHDIWSLKHRLGVYETTRLQELGYDVGAYWDHHDELFPAPVFNKRRDE